ncbi:hypothetical protein [Burkholderia gladioli]|uniref:hypothetical protein n=1 Tax=Burkholderia gladioli TaxID=28095 RepID=UPI000BF17312|nr:hypothetical protein [Burkholderia gladioli]PEH86147.1 hypothetical protein CRM95_14945 [Burkholderia gladioli]
MRMPIISTFLLALASVSANAATSITIDARQNCIQGALNPNSPYGAPATFQLAPGRYVMSLSSDSMSCSGGNVTPGCLIDGVIVQGGWGNARWGVSVRQQPIVVDVGGSGNANLWAYTSDDVCSDNSGQATLLIQQTN